MEPGIWTIKLTGQAKKAHKELPKDVHKILITLIKEMTEHGYHLHTWPNFSKLDATTYHCHLQKGRPTYVACWRIFKNIKLIEVYYAGTHEKAPY